MEMKKKSENKNERYPVSSIIKKIENHTIRFDHPAQRHSDQWNNKMKGNLISDILQGNPIPPIILAEQIINGVSIVWNLDGKQRCTNIYGFIHGDFKISSQVRRSIITYQSNKKDEKGKLVLDENGIPVVEVCEFNIANKTYNQLPVELQDKINDYLIDAVLYLDCSSEDIVYHIARYNDGKPMNKIQKGIVNLGEDFATEVKNISEHSFFTDCCDFGSKGKSNGNIDRCICETIMISNHLDKWDSTNLERMCEFLRENATIDEFEDLESDLDCLEGVVNEEGECLFTNKDTFIWLTVFHKFKTFGLDDEAFGEFLTTFINDNLREVEVNGNKYADLESNRCTKDKSLIIKKLNHIEFLMKKYFGLEVDSAA